MKIRFCHAVAVMLLLLIAGVALVGCEGGKKDRGTIDPNVAKFTLLPEFEIEHLHNVSEHQQGSWVAMTFDDKGRMIVSDHYGALYRLEIPDIGLDSVKPRVEQLTQIDGGLEFGYAQGLVWAHNSLYALVSKEGFHDVATALYRLQDTDHDDRFDRMTNLITFEGDGEHGAHSVVLGPDGESIYLVLGNYINVGAMDHYRLPATWDEDNVLPLIRDPQGHATDRQAPGGWIMKTDSIGASFELVAAGLRNPFDIAFNGDGEMFTYDADMEWDLGMPWYRPTRILHVTSGAEFGWRTGNSKWPPYFPDNLPAVANIGQGSPTNLLYAGHAKFPGKTNDRLLAFDWSFGIIYSVTLAPQGASYIAEVEEFLSAPSLPLTDGVIGPDGALYFLTGGRTLQSDLYRVYHKNHAKINKNNPGNRTLDDAAVLRKELEKLHRPTRPDSGAIERIWPHLAHHDRHVRYAARIALEHQPTALWQDRARNETHTDAVIESMIALVRKNDPVVSSQEVLQKVMSIDFPQSTETQQLGVLRVVELALARNGRPAGEVCDSLIAYLDRNYPSASNLTNRELSKLLGYLDSPSFVARTIPLLLNAQDDASYQQESVSSAELILRNPSYGLDIAKTLSSKPPAQQIHYALVLSQVKSGWTPEYRETYFAWFRHAFGFKGGNSYIGFINRTRKMALENVAPEQFDHYNALSGDSLVNPSGLHLAAKVAPPKGPGRNWEVAIADSVINSDTSLRNFARGKELFAATLCNSCHSMGGGGGSFGPDLTQLGTRFSVKDVLQSIVSPHDAISDQYASKVFYLKDGSTVIGRLMDTDGSNYYVAQNPYAPDVLKKVEKQSVIDVSVSDISIMPAGLINPLNEDELRDLMAYLMSGGKEDDPIYQHGKGASHVTGDINYEK